MRAARFVGGGRVEIFDLPAPAAWSTCPPARAGQDVLGYRPRWDFAEFLELVRADARYPFLGLPHWGV